VRHIKPLARSERRCRQRGTPPRRDADCRPQWRFPHQAFPSGSVWRIEGLLTRKLYRNGCIRARALGSPGCGVLTLPRHSARTLVANFSARGRFAGKTKLTVADTG